MIEICRKTPSWLQCWWTSPWTRYILCAVSRPEVCQMLQHHNTRRIISVRFCNLVYPFWMLIKWLSFLKVCVASLLGSKSNQHFFSKKTPCKNRMIRQLVLSCLWAREEQTALKQLICSLFSSTITACPNSSHKTWPSLSNRPEMKPVLVLRKLFCQCLQIMTSNALILVENRKCKKEAAVWMQSEREGFRDCLFFVAWSW